MKYIIVVSDSREIQNPRLLALFHDKVKYLSDIMERFDKEKIKARILMKGREGNKLLYTSVVAECENEAFRFLLEDSIGTYNIA
jgi:hypothetical protein